MIWKMSGDRPVYQQIISLIRGAVLSGEYPPGSRIPSVRELASQAGVNPNTMQRALSELEREGLLVGAGTAGRCVTADQAVLEQTRQTVIRELARECAEKFLALGLTPSQGAELLRALEKEKEE